MSEKDEQIALFERAQYCDITRDYMFAIPNGGFRNKGEAASLKRQGVKPGVSDVFLAYPMLPYYGLWIELKTKLPRLGKVTPEQLDWIKRMEGVGYEAVIAYGWEEAWHEIEQYLTRRI